VPETQRAFDYVSGEALGAPVLEDVRTYPVTVADGTVFIEIG
jgi:3-phenylpropionate/trans-cinnamate dioxygenase ferredoxin component